ncbi:type II toxin-antitoxin system VapC family toxin [Candidatus Acetothermia bacterium]|nr:type II toxin-antitoxin system VapC family toxin [Candidatus Acetothermia bacterium]
MLSEKTERSAPLFIDSNIFIYAAGSAEDEEDSQLRDLKLAAKAVILALGGERLHAVTSLVVLQEIVYFFHRWARKDKALVRTGKQVVSQALALMAEVYPLRSSEFTRALTVYEPSKHDFNDLLIAEVMHSQGLTEILTADRDYERFEEIKRVDPLMLVKQLERTTEPD